MHRVSKAYQRAGRRGIPRDGLREDIRAARKGFRMAISKAQEASWRDLANSVEADPWGRAYKIVSRKIGGPPPGAEAAGRETMIADGLFPSASPPSGLVGDSNLV